MNQKTMNMTKDEREIEAAKAAITKKRSALPHDHPIEMAIREIDYRKSRLSFSYNPKRRKHESK